MATYIKMLLDLVTIQRDIAQLSKNLDYLEAQTARNEKEVRELQLQVKRLSEGLKMGKIR